MKTLTHDEIKKALDGKGFPKRHPSDSDVFDHMKEHPSKSFYSAREDLRNEAFGGLPPIGYESWGDFWKSY